MGVEYKDTPGMHLSKGTKSAFYLTSLRWLFYNAIHHIAK